MSEEDIRIDKWLWAVRLFKTRTLAAEAVKAGHVRMGGETFKPAKAVHPGDVFTIQQGVLRKTVRVVALLEKRVGAKLVPQYLEDLTPPEEYAKLKTEKPPMVFPKGFGRPTKKDRRDLEKDHWGH